MTSSSQVCAVCVGKPHSKERSSVSGRLCAACSDCRPARHGLPWRNGARFQHCECLRAPSCRPVQRLGWLPPLHQWHQAACCTPNDEGLKALRGNASPPQELWDRVATPAAPPCCQVFRLSSHGKRKKCMGGTPLCERITFSIHSRSPSMIAQSDCEEHRAPCCYRGAGIGSSRAMR